MAAETFSGSIKRITFHNPENGYTVARLQMERGRVLALVGTMPGIAQGQDIQVSGKLVLHPKFGEQVEVESYELAEPSGQAGVRRFLASGLIKGVGPKLAGAIVDTLGPEALERIDQDPAVLGRVPGIGKKRVKSISQALKDHAKLRELMVFLQGHGVAAGTALRIYRQYGAGALGVVKNSPHRLAADIQGIGFATADAIAKKLGISEDHPTRIQAGLLHTLNQALNAGHVHLPYEELMEEAARLLGLERGLLGPAFARLHNERQIILEEDGDIREVYLAPWHYLEERAAQALAKLAQRPGILPPERAEKAVEWVSDQMKVRPSAAQGQALVKLMTAGCAVLSGGPGTGKTTLVRALITIALRMKLTVELAAPTGRAAKRLQEAGGQPAQTLHRLLEYSPKENRFLRGRDKPLDADLVIVDESSMVDLWLMTHLAEAMGPKARLVLVGDANQLPSVGPGLVLRQIIDSGRIPVAMITEIFRQDQAGLIVRNAHRVLSGKMPLMPEAGAKADFRFIAEPDPDRAAKLVRDLACRRIPQKMGLDPVRDIQVLAPMHRGRLGCQNLNMLMRAALNPGAGDQRFAHGDKVMQVRNNYDLEAFNGDLGVIGAADDDGALVTLGDRTVSYSMQEMDDLVLAYAVTIHKSQGSEYPAVVIALGNEHFIMLNRPLLYTAMTRGRELVVIVGHPSALKRAVQTADPSRRYANLDKKLARLADGKINP